MLINDFIKLHDRNNGSKPWTNYCEAIYIDGEIFDAVPSHQYFLLNYICKKYNTTFNELNKEIPAYSSVVSYLAEKYKAIVLWYNMAKVYPYAFNNKEISNLFIELIKSGLLSYEVYDNTEYAYDYSNYLFNTGNMNYDEYVRFLNTIRYNLKESIKKEKNKLWQIRHMIK